MTKLLKMDERRTLERSERLDLLLLVEMLLFLQVPRH